jgi:hypothetical protein
LYETKNPQKAKVIMSKKNKAGSTILPDLKLKYKAELYKQRGIWHKKKTHGPGELNLEQTQSREPQSKSTYP